VVVTKPKDTLPHDPMIGTVLGDTYQLVNKIGEGGMATVYEATHTRIERHFAIKVLQIKAAKFPEMLVRFEREARIGSRLGHDHIVQVLDFNHTPKGEPYLVMELLEGEDLGAMLEKEAVFPVEWAIAVIRQVASALKAAHEHDVVHRDLKPENIFLCGQPRQRVMAKVMDFGISKIMSSKSFVTRDSTIFGTPWYMSPEQAQGHVQKIDQSTDLYAMGVLLYRLVGNKLPYDGQSIPTVLYKIVHDVPEPLETIQPGLPQGLVPIINRAMHKDPQQRYGNAAELMTELEQAMGERWNKVLAWCQAPENRTIQVDWAEECKAVVPPASTGKGPQPSTLSDATGEMDHPDLSGLRSKARWIVPMAVLLVITALGVTAWLGLGSGEDKLPDKITAAVADPPVVPDARTVAKAPVPTADARSAPMDTRQTRMLSVTTTPAGARVMINGNEVGRTPIKNLAVELTPLSITVSIPGYASITKKLPEGSDPQRLDLRLTPRPASLNVVGLHRGKSVPVDVYINGRKRDQAPAIIRELTPGRYTIRLQGGGFRSRERQVRLRPGQNRREVFELRR
jgi:serine/threonine-protein kinase